MWLEVTTVYISGKKTAQKKTLARCFLHLNRTSSFSPHCSLGVHLAANYLILPSALTQWLLYLRAPDRHLVSTLVSLTTITPYIYLLNRSQPLWSSQGISRKSFHKVTHVKDGMVETGSAVSVCEYNYLTYLKSPWRLRASPFLGKTFLPPRGYSALSWALSFEGVTA